MKAVIQTAYGSADVLEVREIDKPVIGDDEVLIRVQAASIAAGDYFTMMGKPVVVRLFVGVSKPKKDHVVGLDVAGCIEAVGKNVTLWQVGDKVFGECKGACAEYARASADKLAPMPSNMTPEQAAAVTTSATTAMLGLRDAGKLQRDQKVLINGAAGGVGTFAVQIAKALGATVTGVCSTRNVDMVRSIGADHVIDYTQDDFTQDDERYDLIFDNVANHSLSEFKQVLAPEGILVSNSGHAGLGYIAKAGLSSIFSRHQASPFVAMPKTDDLVELKEMIEDGEITSVIDRTYPLAETPDAFAHASTGHAQGKVVIVVEQPA